MPVNVDIDGNSGFCGGVIRAIRRAEDCLARNGRLYSLGAIVHNEAELARLEAKGLTVISDEDILSMQDVRGEHLLIRAHGAAPGTYRMLEDKGFIIEDCTCPVVLKLQKDILQSWKGGSSVIIFGKVGHAEVLGLVGQTEGEAVVIENMEALEKAISEGRVRIDRPAEIFSQTTKNPEEYDELCNRLGALMEAEGAELKIHRTICSQVASRHSGLAEFARSHDVIVFVSGKASSNGKVLCDLCRENNPRTHHIDSQDGIRSEWFGPSDSVGVCGATSTPKWLLELVAQKILQLAR